MIVGKSLGKTCKKRCEKRKCEITINKRKNDMKMYTCSFTSLTARVFRRNDRIVVNSVLETLRDFLRHQYKIERKIGRKDRSEN